MATLTRVVVLACSAALCALVAGLAAVYTHSRSLAPSSVWDSLGDPFGRVVWLGATLVGAILGFVFSVWALWRAHLKEAVPTVIAVTVSTAALSAPILGPLSALVALVAGVTTMIWCRDRMGAVINRTHGRQPRKRLLFGIPLAVFVVLFSTIKPLTWLIVPPRAARPDTIEREYDELLACLRSYAQRLNAEAQQELRGEILADSRFQELCAPTEILGIWIEKIDSDDGVYLQLHGVDPAHIGGWGIWYPPAIGYSRTFYSWKGDYEFAYYVARYRDGASGVVEIQLMLDYLQLKGFQGTHWWKFGGGVFDPRPEAY
jgi:hypothetical protein